MSKKPISEEENLIQQLKEKEVLIAEARAKLADRIPYWEKVRDEATVKVAEASKMLALLRGVPAVTKVTAKREGAVRDTFMKWFDAIPSGTTVTMKQMIEETGIPRGTVWGIKEAILEEGIIAEVGRGVYKKL